MTISSSAGPPYEAGQQLTCAADSDNVTYVWSGTNGGSSFSSTSSIVTLQGGEFCLICTVTVDSDPKCSTSAFLCDSASGKYRIQHNNLVAIFLLTRIRSVERGVCPITACCTIVKT